MKEGKSYKEITRTEEPWVSLFKILAFRMNVNKIENMLYSIFAMHALDRADCRDGRYPDVYKEIWDELGKFHGQLRRINKEYRRTKEGGEGGEGEGCWNDDDCADDYWCNEEYVCTAPPKPPIPNENET